MKDETMFNRSTPNWLAAFTVAVPCSPGFIMEMDKQLGESFKEITGLDFIARFQFCAPLPEPFQIIKDDSKVCFLEWLQVYDCCEYN